MIFCLLLAAAAGIFAFFAWQPAIEPIKPPAAASFDPAVVRRGAALAVIGSCAACHTAPGGRALAGGVAIPTPFGTIYSTNITPDPETGIGGWSEAAFQRAMRKGVRRDGALLYPAFPYDHFALVSDEDNRALYAYLMTRAPVRAVARGNDLSFPLNYRFVVAGWNLLYLPAGPYRAEPAHDGAWNRGAYLAEGLGHCGACHTPRNGLGAERTDARFSGGAVEGWTAYALNAASPAAVPWTAEALFNYLRRGFEDHHGVARGPMAQVVAELGAAPEADVRAIAAYVAAQAGATAAARPQVAQQVATQSRRGTTLAAASADSQANRTSVGDGHDAGAAVYAAACAGCHEGPRAMPYGGIDLALSSAVSGPNASNLVNIILLGVPAAAGTRGPIMPAFANAIDDNQLAALTRYVRARFTDRQSWTGIEDAVHAARGTEQAIAVSYAPQQAGER